MTGLDKMERDQILSLAAKHWARDVRVFGSVARGEGRTDSDIDFLMEVEKDRSLFEVMSSFGV